MGQVELAKLREMARQFGVENIADVLLDDHRFVVWSGSSKPDQHHYGKHGLIIHTLEVVELCLLNNGYFSGYKKVDSVKLFLSALFHDAGKMWDYVPTNDALTEWKGGPHKRQVHHISRSAIVWQEASANFDDPHDEVLHAILAHHGRREWGSPVEPASSLAWLLHFCDGISARLDDCNLREPS